MHSHTGPLRRHHRERLLEKHLAAAFGDLGSDAAALLREHLVWVEIAGGDTLMTQGDPGDSLYLTISGRLRAYVHGDDGAQRLVREISRGQIVGEMSLYSGDPRSATVIAIRDSVLVRLAKPEFERLLSCSAQASIALTRQVIQRMQREENRPPLEKPVTIGLVPVTEGVDVAAFASLLAAQLACAGRVRVVDAGAIDRELGHEGSAECDASNADVHHATSLLLDEIEAANDYVLLVGGARPGAWTRRCSGHADELLLLADASRPAELHPNETELLMQRPPRSEAAEILVLLHAAEAISPRGTAQWLARRPVAGHVHVRPALERDMARLARIQSRTAVGLVLAGGGARGFAHLGIYRALREHGIEIDCVGGTSIGAVMAAYVASDRPQGVLTANARRAFGVNPTGDYNLLPLLSLVKGARLRRVLAHAVNDLFGFDADLEDLWKNCYCIATNYSRACEHLMQHGNLARSLLASISIPGALPPVLHDGELLCDGGTFNNFPVDVMHAMRGVGTVIGVDLNHRQPRRIEHAEMPGSWALLRDRLRPRAKRRYRLPSLASYLMNVTVLYSMSRQREAQKHTHLYFNPPLERVGMLAWSRLDQIIAQGHAHGIEVLAGLPAELRARFSPWMRPPASSAGQAPRSPGPVPDLSR